MSPVEFPWSRASGGRWISAQPVTCYSLWLAISFLLEKGGAAFWKEVEMYLIENGVGPKKDVRTMLKNYNFVTENKSGKISLNEWVYITLHDKNSKQDILLTLAAGIFSGGYSIKARKKAELTEGILMGTRLMLFGLKRIFEKYNDTMISLERLALEIQQRDIVAINCIRQLLDMPTRTNDPYALGILETIGGSGDPRKNLIKFDAEVIKRLKSYQISIMSRYLCYLIPHLIKQKYGISIEKAIEKNLNIINKDELTAVIKQFPAIWLDERDLGEILREVTEEKYKYVWWGGDRSKAGIGLLDDPRYCFLKVTKKPFFIELKNPYHF